MAAGSAPATAVRIGAAVIFIGAFGWDDATRRWCGVLARCPQSCSCCLLFDAAVMVAVGELGYGGLGALWLAPADCLGTFRARVLVVLRAALAIRSSCSSPCSCYLGREVPVVGTVSAAGYGGGTAGVMVRYAPSLLDAMVGPGVLWSVRDVAALCPLPCSWYRLGEAPFLVAVVVFGCPGMSRNYRPCSCCLLFDVTVAVAVVEFGHGGLMVSALPPLGPPVVVLELGRPQRLPALVSPVCYVPRPRVAVAPCPQSRSWNRLGDVPFLVAVVLFGGGGLKPVVLLSVARRNVLLGAAP